MKKLRTAAIVAATGLAVLLPVSFDAAKARVHGFGGHAYHHRHGNFGAGAWYGGYVETAPYVANDAGYAPQQPIVYLAPALPALACHHSEETIAVPTEGGGTRDIRVTRC